MNNNFYKNWKAAIINERYSLKDTIKNLNKTALQVCFVTRKKRFIGTISDGDIRRALLKGFNLSDRIDLIINRKPKFILKKDLYNHKYLKKLKKTFSSHLIPILSQRGEMIDIFLDQKNYFDFNKVHCEIAVVTGGKGKRLMPLTKKIPKALIKVSGKPILENIILKGRKEGIQNFNLITNHFHSKIKQYFKDGKKFSVKIKYFKENAPLGTAGGLSLLRNKKNKTKLLIVTNCDILTNLNYSDLIEFHLKNKNKVTIASRFFKMDNPYGVMKLSKNNQVFKIEEKPSQNHLISAGIYIMNFSVLNYLKKNKKIDMTDFLNILLKKKIKIGTCLIHENWLDIGNKSDLKKINNI